MSAKLSLMALGKGITRYLNECEDQAVNGRNGNVHLGAIPEMPGQTSDPKIVAKAIKYVEAQAREASSPTKRLERYQRVITLKRELARLEAGPDYSARDFFVEHALEYATTKGIGYSAFRMMGVPVDALNEAGIDRTFEP